MPEKKAKASGRLRKMFFALLGKARTEKFLTFLLNRKHRSPPLEFPIDIGSAKEVLLILPENHLQVIHQLRNVISLMGLFKHCAITLLAERSVAPYIKMVPGLTIVEYDIQDHYSKEFSELAQQFRGSVDICILLNPSPDLPVLYLAGATAARVRAGYIDAGDSPFLNFHVRPSANRVYLPDWYCALADVFGAHSGEIRWRVAQKTVEEVDHLIRELKINPDIPLIGFDALYFLRTFGVEWTERFMQRINELNLGTTYFILQQKASERELVWLCKCNVPSFAELSVSRMAALVGKSKFIVSGNTTTYALAGLLQRPAFGFFREDEIVRYCPQSPVLKGVAYSASNGSPTPEELDRMVAIIEKTFAAPAPSRKK